MKMAEQTAAQAQKLMIWSFLGDKTFEYCVLDIQGSRTLAGRPSGVNFSIAVRDSRSKVSGLEILQVIL